MRRISVIFPSAVTLLLFVLTLVSQAQQSIPNSGQLITPTAPAGAAFVPLNPGLADNPQYLAGQAVTSLVSPDGKTLLVLTSGYNMLNDSSGHADSRGFDTVCFCL